MYHETTEVEQVPLSSRRKKIEIKRQLEIRQVNSKSERIKTIFVTVI